MNNYEDIRHLKRPKSNHPPMRRQDRAKIFAPFAALSGHGEAVHARDKVLVLPVIQTEYTKDRINRALLTLQLGDTVTIVYFSPQVRTPEDIWGEYVTVSATVTKIAPYARILQLGDMRIPFDDIAEIRSDQINKLEEQHEYPW